jgi:hypothetical protein
MYVELLLIFLQSRKLIPFILKSHQEDSVVRVDEQI